MHLSPTLVDHIGRLFQMTFAGRCPSQSRTATFQLVTTIPTAMRGPLCPTQVPTCSSPNANLCTLVDTNAYSTLPSWNASYLRQNRGRYPGEGGRRSCDGEDYHDGGCCNGDNASLVEGVAEHLRGCTSSRCCRNNRKLNFVQTGLVRSCYSWVVYRYCFSC